MTSKTQVKKQLKPNKLVESKKKVTMTQLEKLPLISKSMPTLPMAAMFTSPTKSVMTTRSKSGGALGSADREESSAAADYTKEHGHGTHEDPFHRPLRVHPNRSNCYHCPEDQCSCNMIAGVIQDTFDALDLKRETEIAGQKGMCAKSLLPVFVSRFVREMKITSDTIFYDLGCGNGSILFQVAYMTGAKCIGVELNKRNAELARQAWDSLKPRLEKLSKRKMPEVEIIAGDLSDVISDENWGDANTVVWTANLLMPKAVTHYMSERFRDLPPGARVMCFDDLYPHGRSVARIRDPEAFELFEMIDYTWQEYSVEWCTLEGRWYFHRRV